MINLSISYGINEESLKNLNEISTPIQLSLYKFEIYTIFKTVNWK